MRSKGQGLGKVAALLTCLALGGAWAGPGVAAAGAPPTVTVTPLTIASDQAVTLTISGSGLTPDPFGTGTALVLQDAAPGGSVFGCTFGPTNLYCSGSDQGDSAQWPPTPLPASYTVTASLHPNDMKPCTTLNVWLDGVLAAQAVRVTGSGCPGPAQPSTTQPDVSGKVTVTCGTKFGVTPSVSTGYKVGGTVSAEGDIQITVPCFSSGSPAPAPKPAVGAISPSAGPAAGGQTVTIGGAGFTGATAVRVGSASATYQVVSDNEIEAVVPPGTGTVDLVVVGPNGQSDPIPADRYTYQGGSGASTPAAPAITDVTLTGPAQGASPTITITGSGFGSNQPYTGISGNPGYVVVQDVTAGWQAGGIGGPVVVSVSSWSDGQIVLSGLGGAFGSAGHVLSPNDQLSVTVYNPTTGAASPPFGVTVAKAEGGGFTDLSGYGWAAGAISTLAAQGVVRGTAPGVFDPAGDVTRAEFAALMQRMFSLPAPASPITFSDVPPTYWGYGAVQAAAQYFGPTPPSSGAAFQPDAALDRQDVAAAMVRILAARGAIQVLDAADAATTLQTVTDAGQLAPGLQVDVATAIQAGLLTGFPDGTFQPQGLLTRAQVAVILQRLEAKGLASPTVG